jgi:hypothetical protein
MAKGIDKLLENRRAYLHAIGQSLKADYDAIAGPIPERLMILVKHLYETRVSAGPPEIEPAPLPPAPLPLWLDPDGQRVCAENSESAVLVMKTAENRS